MSISMNMMQLFNENVSSPCTSFLRFEHGSSGTAYPIRVMDSNSNSGHHWKIRAFSKIPSFDEDSGLGMECDMTEAEPKMFGFGDAIGLQCDELNGSFNRFTPPACKGICRPRRGIKKNLFAGKRTMETENPEEDLSPCIKKIRQGDSSLLKPSLTNSYFPRPDTDNTDNITKVNNITDAVDRMTTENDLIADGSRDYCLPTIAGKHSDLKTISSETMENILRGKYDHTKPADIKIVDCRFPYEFEGGHIQGAVNLYTKDAVHDLLKLSEEETPRILIFHCEFSSERGPKMFRFLRSSDRDLNKENYPKLNYPEIYLLEGGYKVFFTNDKTLCEPQTYKPMLHKDHTDDLRHFRLKSKSCAAGQDNQPRKSRKTRSRLSLNY